MAGLRHPRGNEIRLAVVAVTRRRREDYAGRSADADWLLGAREPV